jgi:outer membrane protein assembly factor BamB
MKASPAVAGGRVFVGTLDGKFHAVDAKTGQKLWTFETGGEIHAAANFYKGDVFFGCHDANLYRFKPDGTKVWALTIDGPINAAAPVVGDVTFATGCSDGKLYIVDLKQGKVLDTVALNDQSIAASPATEDKVYMAMVGSQIVAVDWKAKKTAWAFSPKRRQQPFDASPAVTDKLVIAGSKDRKVYALDRETGAEKWNFVTEGAVDASPVVVGNRIYVGCMSTTGEFYVLDLDGKQVQQLILDSAVTGSVGVGPDCIVVGSDKGSVYCLGAKK